MFKLSSPDSLTGGNAQSKHTWKTLKSMFLDQSRKSDKMKRNSPLVLDTQ